MAIYPLCALWRWTKDYPRPARGGGVRMLSLGDRVVVVVGAVLTALEHGRLVPTMADVDDTAARVRAALWGPRRGP